MRKKAKAGPLAFCQEVIIPRVEGFIPFEFLAQPGLEVDLHPEILQEVKRSVEVPGVVQLHCFDVVEERNALEIKNILLNKCEVGWWPIALLIAKQGNGEAGPLVLDCGANLFFFPDCCVRVFRTHGRWSIRDWDLEYLGVDVKDRVFCRNSGRVLQ